MIGANPFTGSNATFSVAGPTACVLVVPIASVCPSGAAFATTAVPTVPPAPPRFSITTGCPNSLLSPSATTRPTMSVEPPGGNGTISVIGLVG